MCKLGFHKPRIIGIGQLFGIKMSYGICLKCQKVNIYSKGEKV